LTEVKSTTSNLASRRPGRENEVAPTTTLAGKAKEKPVEDTKPLTKPSTTRPTVREALRAVGGTAHHVRGAHSRSASVSTTASASDVPVKKQPKVVTGKVTVKKESIVFGSTRPSVFSKAARTASTSVKVEDPEEGRVFKKGRIETVAEVTAPVFQNDESQAEADTVAEELEKEVDHEMMLKAEEAEEKAKPQLWDDLDAADWDDPASVAEYIREICDYLKAVEVCPILLFIIKRFLPFTKIQTLPNANYMDHQREIDWEKRGVLVDWVLQVHAKFGLLPETLFLFTNILDRFLSSRSVDLLKLQLVGITAFFIAAKYEETYCPSVTEIAYLAENAYTVEEILKAERYMLKTIGWDLRYPGPMTWLRRGSKADECDLQARTVAKYLCEIGCLEWRLVGTTPSMIATAAMWLARLTLGKEDWVSIQVHLCF
jgi:G2/mitotic-specific cyclin 2